MFVGSNFTHSCTKSVLAKWSYQEYGAWGYKSGSVEEAKHDHELLEKFSQLVPAFHQTACTDAMFIQAHESGVISKQELREEFKRAAS